MHQVETMAYANEVPWHGLGTSVDSTLTPLEMLEQAEVNWTVSKHNLFFNSPDGEEQIGVDDRMVLVRDSDNTPLSIVGPRWEPIQNHEAFSVFHDFVEKGGMTMETAGSLRNGRMVWALAKTTEEFRVFGDDIVRGYFLFSNPHEYGQVATFGGTSVRVVCNNTLSMATRAGLDNKISINHRRPFDIDAVNESLAELRVRLIAYQTAAEALGSASYTDDTLAKYFGDLFPVSGQNAKRERSRNAEKALEIIETQPGAEYGRGTWWQAFNAGTYMVDHVVGNSNDTRLTNAWFGSGSRQKNRALDRALEYAAA